MFLFLGILFVSTLLSFGAVLPYSSEFLMVIWFLGAALWLVARILREGRTDALPITILVAGGISLIYLGPKPGVFVLAMLWAWEAARRNPRGVRRFFHFLLIVGILEALLGLFQYFAAPGWILGYQNSSGNVVSGTLINRNHFAGLIEMLIPVAIGLGFIVARKHREVARPYIYILSGAVMALAIIFSLSRMGIFSFLATLLFIFILLQVRSSHRRMAVGLGLGLFGLVAAGAIWIGIDTIVQRYEALLAQGALVQEGRIPVYRDTIRMIQALPAGVGIGKYQDVFRQYQTFRPDFLWDHAHNDYLETTAEWGIVPAGIFWIFVGVVFVKCVRTFLAGGPPEQQGILLACTGAMFSILVHSLADFNLQIPSNAMLFFSFVGISMGMRSQPQVIQHQ